MKISVVNSQKKIKIDAGRLKNTANTALSFLGESGRMLSVRVVDDAQIAKLNRKYLRVDRATDVIAFSMDEAEAIKGSDAVIGDVVISAETALKQSKRFKTSLRNELDLYLVHGILHLAGYDDLKARDKKNMEKKQKEILHEAAKHSRKL